MIECKRPVPASFFFFVVGHPSLSNGVCAREVVLELFARSSIGKARSTVEDSVLCQFGARKIVRQISEVLLGELPSSSHAITSGAMSFARMPSSHLLVACRRDESTIDNS